MIYIDLKILVFIFLKVVLNRYIALYKICKMLYMDLIKKVEAD
jgi:hypothetical protein